MSDELQTAWAERTEESNAVLSALIEFAKKRYGRPLGPLDYDDIRELRALTRLFDRCAFEENKAWTGNKEAQETEAREEEAGRAAAIFRKRQQAAHAAVAAAIQSGELVRPMTCERCPDEALDIVAHHHDYDKPLDVEWLCRPCHGKHHADHGPAL
jgi:hypothetical protein